MGRSDMSSKVKEPKATSTRPGPGEVGYDKMAVPQFVLELLRQHTAQEEVVKLVQERYPYTRLNSNHVAWMASAQSFTNLDIEGEAE